MEGQALGHLVNYYRNKYQLSQEDVCDGLCSLATFSRFELGEREIDPYLCEIMLERIGKSLEAYEIILDNKEYALWQIRQSVEEELAVENFSGAENLLDQYLNEMPKENVHWQFYRKCKGYISMRTLPRDEKLFNSVIQEFCEALFLTKPDGIKSTEKLYSMNEIELYLYIAELSENLDKNIYEENLKKMSSFLEQYYSDYEGCRVRPLVLYKYVSFLSDEGRREEALVQIESALDRLRKGMQFRASADFHLLKAKMLYENFRAIQDMQVSTILLNECRMAYYIYSVYNQEKADTVLNYAKEVLHADIQCE